MKKIKTIIGVIFLVIVLLGIGFLFANVQKWMPNYEGKTLSFANQYLDNQESNNPLEYIEKATLQRPLTQEEEALFRTDTIQALWEDEMQFATVIDGDMLTKMEKYKEEYVVPETKYGDIIYQSKQEYIPDQEYSITNTILFTKDLANIYYCRKDSSKSLRRYVGVLEIDQDELIQEIYMALYRLNLSISNFNPEIEKKGDLQYMAIDEKNNLKIVYDIIDEQIVELQYRF